MEIESSGLQSGSFRMAAMTTSFPLLLTRTKLPPPLLTLTWACSIVLVVSQRLEAQALQDVEGRHVGGSQADLQVQVRCAVVSHTHNNRSKVVKNTINCSRDSLCDT
jgi:hypothetical protein